METHPPVAPSAQPDSISCLPPEQGYAIDGGDATAATRAARAQRLFLWALAISLALHGLILCIKVSPPSGSPGQQTAKAASKLDVQLKPQKRTPVQIAKTPPPAEKSPRILAMPRKPNAVAAAEPEPRWTVAERDEMKRFMQELEEENRPPTGQELAQRAKTMAREMRAPPDPDAEEARSIMNRLYQAHVEPFTVEMYFDALFRKMNRSAEMIGRQQHERGTKVAAVRVTLNADGSLRSFRILRAADQQNEIDFIKAVVHQASPFPAFPSDIRTATDTIILNICIRPGGFSDGSMFSRMGAGEECR